jgi:hypothetical protein
MQARRRKFSSEKSGVIVRIFCVVGVVERGEVGRKDKR